MTRRALLFFSAGLVFALALGLGGLPAPALRPGRAAPAVQPQDPRVGEGRARLRGLPSRSAEDGRFAGIPRIDNCAACHTEPQGETTDEKRLVEEYVTPAREIPWLVYSRQPENVRFPHAIHVKRAKIACERCHGAHAESDALPLHETNRITGYSRDVSRR